MKRFIAKSLAGFFLVAVVVAVWLWFDLRNFLVQPLSVPEEGFILEVKPGSNLTRITQQLAKQDILSKPRYFIGYARWYQHMDKIHVGDYLIEKGSTAESLLQQLAQGKVVQYPLTLVEGWTFEQMLQTIAEDQHLLHTLQGLDPAVIMQHIGYPGIHPEGQFLPDTYLFPRGTTDVAFLQRAYQAMQNYLKEQWAIRDTNIPLQTPAQALILASIIEKETGQVTERQQIAGVFSRRLAKRMRLQSDPTIIYGMGERFDGNIRKRDLSLESPYNTYRIFGLPPTPIAMPGRDAIHASLHPDPGDALYFVAKGNGSHYFSASLDEHNNAVIKYQLKGRKRDFSTYQQDNHAR
jgi:UPF0755 protein